MKKLLCQGVWETHSQGFAETPWIQLVLSAVLPEPALMTQSPSKEQECTADGFAPANLHPHLRKLISPCVLLPLFLALGTARKQL